MQLLRQGDTLKVTRLDRLSRSVLHVIEQGIHTATMETPSGSRTLAVAVQVAFSGRRLLGEQLDRDVAARGVGVRANLVGGLDELATDFSGQAVR